MQCIIQHYTSALNFLQSRQSRRQPDSRAAQRTSPAASNAPSAAAAAGHSCRAAFAAARRMYSTDYTVGDQFEGPGSLGFVRNGRLRVRERRTDDCTAGPAVPQLI